MDTGDLYVILLTLLTEVVILVQFFGKYKELDAWDWAQIANAVSGTLSMVLACVLIFKIYVLVVRTLLRGL